MTHTSILTLAEIESMGPPAPEEIADTNVSQESLCDLALKHIAMLAEPTTRAVAERICLPRTLTEELLQQLHREKFIEVRQQTSPGATRYAMLDRGWARVAQLRLMCGYTGPAPVALGDYAHLMRLQAVPRQPANIEAVRRAFDDLVLPDSLLQTLGCVINSRRSLFLTGLPGTGKTAVAERINSALVGAIWIPYAIEIDNQVIRVFDAHSHRLATAIDMPAEYDRRWVLIERPLVIVGGELTLEHTNLAWSETARFYEAPFQMKANGGTLVIDDFGRQRVAPEDLLNRWIVPLERRVDYLSMQTGQKIEVPFEQLVLFSTNLEAKDLVDEAFLRRMGYRARIELPTPHAYTEIFKRVAAARGIAYDKACLDHLLNNYIIEQRPMKSCEPRDLLNRVADICFFEGLPLELTTKLLNSAWRNYFGASHSFVGQTQSSSAREQTDADLLQV